MTDSKRSDILVNSLRNPTKLRIITLLLQKGSMTVTQMSKILHTTRSNLYQAVAELVSDGLVKRPEIMVKKGYIEKYYAINEEAFNSVSDEDLYSTLITADPEKIREIIYSFLTSQSFILNLLAEEFRLADDYHIKKMQELLMKKFLFLSFSKLSDKSFSMVASKEKEILEKLSNSDKNISLEESKNLFLIIGIPSVDFLKFFENEKKD